MLKTAHAVENRTWTFMDTDVQGKARTTTFVGSYLRINGFDSPLGQAYVVLSLDDSRTKSYPLRGFSDADKAYVALQPKRTYAPEPNTYLPRYDQYNPADNSATVEFHQTPHFVFYWGKNVTPEAKSWNDPNFRQTNFDYFEEVWNFNAQVIHAPMPYDGQAQKYKINVYITGTGLSKHMTGFAGGADAIAMHPGALLMGSSVIPHEFTHVLQFYTGGFRDNPNVGWFWECHGNWNCFQFYPSYPAALGVYAERMHYELSSSRMNYGSWPFLQYLAEDPRFGTAFCFDIWKQCHRDKVSGAATETPFETIMRLGVERGIFQSDGLAGFGDVIGNVAARNVTWDYVNQYPMARSLDDYYYSLRRPTGDRTVLRLVPDKPNTYAPMYSQAPRQYGINIIDLQRDRSKNSVTVNFTGIPDEAEGSDWRLTLVALDDKGKARYSPMWRSGSKTMVLQSNETKVSLAIAATPTVYHVQPFRPGFNRKRRHSYELSFMGATPSPVHTPPLPIGVQSHGTSHANGGGFVENSAHVAPTAYVGPKAAVLGNAQVRDNARVEGNAVVRDKAQVSGNAIVGGSATVSGQAQVAGQARIRDAASVSDSVKLTDNARVLEYARVVGNGLVGGNALVKGFGEVFTAPDAPIGGGTVMGEDLEVYAGGYNAPIRYGLIYGYNNSEILKNELKDNNYLYAHWNFNTARNSILLDAFADNDGALRGNPRFSAGSLNFNGNRQYVLVGGISADTADITIDIQLTWTGVTVNQRVFTFGDSVNNMYFTPMDSSGKAAFVITKGGVTQKIQANRALNRNLPSRVSLVLQGDTGKLYLNGSQVGTNARMTFNPEDIVGQWGVIGADMAGKSAFKGSINDMAIYRSGFTTLPTPAR